MTPDLQQERGGTSAGELVGVLYQGDSHFYFVLVPNNHGQPRLAVVRSRRETEELVGVADVSAVLDQDGQRAAEAVLPDKYTVTKFLYLGMEGPRLESRRGARSDAVRTPILTIGGWQACTGKEEVNSQPVFWSTEVNPADVLPFFAQPPREWVRLLRDNRDLSERKLLIIPVQKVDPDPRKIGKTKLNVVVILCEDIVPEDGLVSSGAVAAANLKALPWSLASSLMDLLDHGHKNLAAQTILPLQHNPHWQRLSTFQKRIMELHALARYWVSIPDGILGRTYTKVTNTGMMPPEYGQSSGLPDRKTILNREQAEARLVEAEKQLSQPDPIGVARSELRLQLRQLTDNRMVACANQIFKMAQMDLADRRTSDSVSEETDTLFKIVRKLSDPHQMLLVTGSLNALQRMYAETARIQRLTVSTKRYEFAADKVLKELVYYLEPRIPVAIVDNLSRIGVSAANNLMSDCIKIAEDDSLLQQTQYPENLFYALCLLIVETRGVDRSAFIDHLVSFRDLIKRTKSGREVRKRFLTVDSAREIIVAFPQDHIGLLNEVIREQGLNERLDDRIDRTISRYRR